MLDHDGIENEAASTATLSESAEKADGQNDCPSRGLNHHEIRAYIDSMLGKPDEAAAGEPDPDELAETDRAEKDFGELSESLAGEPDPDELRAYEMKIFEGALEEIASAKTNPLELSRRVARRRQEIVDATVTGHIESMVKLPPAKEHEFRAAYDHVYARPGTGEGQAPTMPEVRERIKELLQYPTKNGEVDRTEKPLPTVYNYELVAFLDPVIHHVGITEFGYHPAWRNVLPPWRRDVESVTSDKAEREKAAKRDQVDDHDLLNLTNRLRSYFGSGYQAVKKEVANEIISLHMGGNRFNPWMEHLDALEAWDGVKRIRQPFSNFKLSEDEADILENAWLAWIHRWYNPGAQLDSVLVLVGEQGRRKSSYISAITEGVIPMSELEGIPESAKDKDDYAAIHASPVVAINEIDRLSLRSEGSKNGTDAKLKNLITTRHDSWRNPYGRFSVNHARPSVFVGTTNHTEFIGDPTGDRRYWVIEIPARILTEDLTREKMDLMLAEARDRYRSGERFRYDEEFEETVARARRKYRSTPTADVIFEWLEKADSERMDRSGSGRRVDADVVTAALIDEQVRFPGKGCPSRNDIITAMDGMDDYQRVDLGGMSRIRRVIDGDSRPVGVAWERVSRYDSVPGESLSVMHEAENRTRSEWKSGQVMGVQTRSHGGMLVFPDRRQVTFADLRRWHFVEVERERKTIMTGGGGHA
ncbi:hypothetical protein AKL16_08590 [Corynebacterium glutamicum]|nr:hypothetical protein AKL16_08590 [Corynebacterium glutamicum]